MTSIEAQTESCFEEIDLVLKAAGATMDDVVKAHIYLADLNDFKQVSPIRDRWFSKSKPASTLTGVTGFSRVGTRIEIEVIAMLEK